VTQTQDIGTTKQRQQLLSKVIVAAVAIIVGITTCTLSNAYKWFITDEMGDYQSGL